MRSIAIPAANSADVLNRCLNATADPVLKARLQAIVPNLAASATAYRANAVAERLDLQARVAAVGAVSKAELVDLYTTHLSATKGAARSIYDQIKNAVPNKKCPLCGVGTVAVLDHHLPKAKYPDLSVVPANLVPACHFCNDTKKARFPISAGEQTLHPYFDDRLIGCRWLTAVVHPGPPLVVTYATTPPAAWTLVDRQRVERHFTVCGIGIVFASNANDELGTLKPWLAQLEAKGGAPEVHAYLAEQAEIHTHRLNSWQLSLYDALVNDPWFVGGGFHSIA
jgi:hypothetical protein